MISTSFIKVDIRIIIFLFSIIYAYLLDNMLYIVLNSLKLSNADFFFCYGIKLIIIYAVVFFCVYIYKYVPHERKRIVTYAIVVFVIILATNIDTNIPRNYIRALSFATIIIGVLILLINYGELERIIIAIINKPRTNDVFLIFYATDILLLPFMALILIFLHISWGHNIPKIIKLVMFGFSTVFYHILTKQAFRLYRRYTLQALQIRYTSYVPEKHHKATQARTYFLLVPLISITIAFILSVVGTNNDIKSLLILAYTGFLMISLLYSFLIIYYIELRFNITLKELAISRFDFFPQLSLRAWAVFATIFLSIASAPIGVMIATLNMSGNLIHMSQGTRDFESLVRFFILFGLPPTISLLINLFVNSYFITDLTKYSDIEYALGSYILGRINKSVKTSVIFSNDPIALNIAKFIIRTHSGYKRGLVKENIIYISGFDIFVAPRDLGLKFEKSVIIVTERPWPRSTFIYNIPGLGQLYLVKLNVTFGEDYLVPILRVDSFESREVFDSVGLNSSELVIAIPKDYDEYIGIITAIREYSSDINMMIYVPHGFQVENISSAERYTSTVIPRYLNIRCNRQSIDLPPMLRYINTIKSPISPVVIQPILRGLKPVYEAMLRKALNVFETTVNNENYICNALKDFLYKLPPIIIVGSGKSTFYLIYEIVKIIIEFLSSHYCSRCSKNCHCEGVETFIRGLFNCNEKATDLADIIRLPIFVIENPEKLAKKPIHRVSIVRQEDNEKRIEEELSKNRIEFKYYVATFLRTIPLCGFAVYSIEYPVRPRTVYQALFNAIQSAFDELWNSNFQLNYSVLIINLEDDENMLNTLESIITLYRTLRHFNIKSLPVVFVAEPTEKAESDLRNLFIRYGQDLFRIEPFNFPYLPSDCLFSKSELLAYRSASIAKLLQWYYKNNEDNIYNENKNNTKKMRYPTFPFIMYGCIENRPLTLYKLLTRLVNDTSKYNGFKIERSFNLRYTHILPCLRDFITFEGSTQRNFHKQDKFLFKAVIEIESTRNERRVDSTYRFRKFLFSIIKPRNINSTFNYLPLTHETGDLLKEFINRIAQTNLKFRDICLKTYCPNAFTCPLREDVSEDSYDCNTRESLNVQRGSNVGLLIYICGNGSDQAGALKQILEFLYGIPRYSRKSNSMSYIANLSYIHVQECLNPKNAFIEIHGLLEPKKMKPYGQEPKINAILFKIIYSNYADDQFEHAKKFILSIFDYLQKISNGSYEIFPKITPSEYTLRKPPYIVIVRKDFYCDDNRCPISKHAYSASISPLWIIQLDNNILKIPLLGIKEILKPEFFENLPKAQLNTILSNLENYVFYRFVLVDRLNNKKSRYEVIDEIYKIIDELLEKVRKRGGIGYAINSKRYLKIIKTSKKIVKENINQIKHVFEVTYRIFSSKIKALNINLSQYYTIQAISLEDVLEIVERYIKIQNEETIEIGKALIDFYKRAEQLFLKDKSSKESWDFIMFFVSIDFIMHLYAEVKKTAFLGLLAELISSEVENRAYIEVGELGF